MNEVELLRKEVNDLRERLAILERMTQLNRPLGPSPIAPVFVSGLTVLPHNPLPVTCAAFAEQTQ